MLFSRNSGFCDACEVLAAKEESYRRQKEEEARIRQEELVRQREAEEERIRQEELERQRKAEEERIRQGELARQRKAEEERIRQEELARQRKAEEERIRQKRLEQQQNLETSHSQGIPERDKSEAEKLEKLTRESMEEAHLLLKEVLDLLKSFFSFSCTDFLVSYRYSEKNIDNYVQLRHAIVLYFAEYIAGIAATLTLDEEIYTQYIEQFIGEEYSSFIDYSELHPLDLTNCDTPWIVKLFAELDSLAISEPKLTIDSMMFTPILLKMLISISGRMQQAHIGIVTKESNQSIEKYNAAITEFYLNEAESITGKRPQISMTSATITKDETNEVTKVTVKTDRKNQSVSSGEKSEISTKKTGVSEQKAGSGLGETKGKEHSSLTSTTSIKPQTVSTIVSNRRQPNSEQQAVISELDNNIILFASAGTGKTFTVANRVGNIILSERALPEEILCLTFTIKAANEMKDDVLQYVGDAGKNVIVKTIHSFCYQVTKEESKKNSDIYCEPSVCDDSDEAEELKNALISLGLSEQSSVFHSSSILNSFMSALKHTRELQNYNSGDEEKDFQRAYDYIRENDQQQFNAITFFYDPVLRRELSDRGFIQLMNSCAGRFAHIYNDILRQSNLVDFDDLICQVHQFMRNKECREYWRNRFKYIIIDEMQDTSTLEYDTIKQMVGANNIMMCGDYFQTIYEWRGSKPDNVLNSFIDEFNAKRFMFAQNYRSTKMLTMATFGYLKKTYPSLVGKFCPPDIVTQAVEEGDKILNVRVKGIEDEALWIMNYLEKNRPEDPTRVCIMARSNTYICNMYSELMKLNSARRNELRFFTVDNDSKFFRKAVIKDILAFINILLNRTDLVSIARIAKKYVPGIGQGTINTLIQDATIGASLTSYLDRGTYEYGDPYKLLVDGYEDSNIVIYDTETTGLDLAKDQIIQISAIKINRNGSIIDTYDQMVIPTIEISKGAQATHHQTTESIKANGGVEAKSALLGFSEFVRGSVLVGHNSLRFDSPLVKRQLRECGLSPLNVQAEYDTMIIAKQFLPKLKNYKLDTLCSHYRFSNENAHNALGDITATGKVLVHLLNDGIIPTTSKRVQMIGKHATKFRPLYQFIESLDRMMLENNVVGIVNNIIVTYDLRSIYPSENDKIAMDDLLFAIKASRFQNAEAYLREFVSDAALSGSQMDLLIQKLHKIPIITVHQSKGCEFDLVMIVGADDDNFPTYIAKKNNKEEEEKRVFYVAITRAKKRLILTSTRSRTNRGGTWPVNQSRYIGNIPAEYIETITVK